MIIAICGADGSGKDTVGRIIQFLTSPIVDIDKVGIDHCIKFVTTEDPSLISNLNIAADYQIKKFGKPVADCYEIITGVDWYSLSREDKEIQRPWFKQFAQEQKKLFGDDVWAKALMKDYSNQDNWIITDLRFPEEVREIIKYRPVIIEIRRPGFEYESSIKHSITHVIDNDSSLEDLVEKVKQLLTNLKSD